MKKKLWRVVSLLMVAVMLTTTVLSSTFAKYVTSGELSDSARVAKWGVTIQTDIRGLFKTDYDFDMNDDGESIRSELTNVVAPGAFNEFRVETKATGTPEVACELSTTARVEFFNWEVEGVFYCPLVFTINGATISGTQFGSADEFETWIKERFELLSAEFQPLTDMSTINELMYLDVSWEWPFEEGDAEIGYTSNEMDTYLGSRAGDNDPHNDPSINITINQTIEQIDEYNWELERYGNKIKFGTYPQSKVTDDKIIAELTEAAEGKTWNSYDYYTKEKNKSDYMRYLDVSVGGVTYRGVCIDEYRPSSPSAGASTTRQENNGYKKGNTYWFKYESIYWTVLSEDAIEGTVFILCNMIIDSQSYDADGEGDKYSSVNNYEESTIRKWLNETFYDVAFKYLKDQNRKEELIIETEIDNGVDSVAPTENPITCNNTKDRIFLLSYADLKNTKYGFEDNSDRVKSTTEYAKSQGVQNGFWLSRSPANVSDMAHCTNNAGETPTSCGTATTYIGIAPALTVQLYTKVHTCEDKDNDHWCDGETCGARLSHHNYVKSEGSENHVCTICGDLLYTLEENSIIKFGSYPQRELTNADDYELLGVLNEMLENGEVEWVTKNGRTYADVAIKDAKYRAIQTAQRSSESVKWYRYDPIAWTVTTDEKGVKTLVATSLLDAQIFDADSNDYKQSDVRTWLNEDFYDTAFDTFEKQLLTVTPIDGLTDKVFLLSESEAHSLNVDISKKTGTSYSNNFSTQNNYWMLRSAGENENSLKMVATATGNMFQVEDIINTAVYVVPVLRINVSTEVHLCYDGYVDHKCDRCNQKISEHSYDGGRCACGDVLYVEDTVNNTIKFGSYPQSLVEDNADNAKLLDALNAKAGELPTATDFKNWTSYEYYVEGKKADYMWYQDVIANGVKYRGVYFTEYRPAHTSPLNLNYEFYYQQRHGLETSKIYWFEYEPIVWTILDKKDDGAALILCNMAIDAQEFFHDEYARTTSDGEEITPNSYEYSTIRMWLNKNFYNTAFNLSQKDAINQTVVDGLQDNVFLLSEEQISGLNNSVLQKQVTEYARSQGIYVDSTGPMWWLRTPCTTTNADGVVKNIGVRVLYDESVTYSTIYYAPTGIVPALTIKLDDDVHACRDRDSDHLCDTCGLRLSNHEYENYKCYCGDTLYSRDGNKIKFGSYPQSDVTNEPIAATLNAMVTNPANDTYDWTSYEYYRAGVQSDFMSYVDIDLDGDGTNDYRGVYIYKYRRESTTITENRVFQHLNGYVSKSVYWFKYEPVNWTILEENNTTAFIICDMIIDSQEYDYKESGEYSSNYEDSTIRAWLKNTFYETAFNSLQKQLIETTKLDNGDTGGNITNDKVFLISHAEKEKLSNEERVKYVSEYALSQGASASGWWWIRSGGGEKAARFVKSNDVTGDFLLPVVNTYISIVPAMNIKLPDYEHTCKDDNADRLCDSCGEDFFVKAYDTASFNSAIEQGSNVKLMNDISLTIDDAGYGLRVQTEGLMLDLNGHILNSTGTTIYVENGKSLVLSDSTGGGKIKGKVAIRADGQVTFESPIDIEGTGGYDIFIVTPVIINCDMRDKTWIIEMNDNYGRFLTKESAGKLGSPKSFRQPFSLDSSKSVFEKVN